MNYASELLYVLLLLSSAENIPLQTTALQRRWREGFEGTRTPPPKEFNGAGRPGRRTIVREAEYKYEVGKR